MPSFVENGPVVLDKKIQILSMYFRYYLPFEKGVALQLNKFESPSPKDVLCQVWLSPSGSGEYFCLGFIVPLENFHYHYR